MKLLELCLSPSYGGLEIHFKDFCSWLSHINDVDLHVAARNNAPVEKSLAEEKITPISLHPCFPKFPLKTARSLSRYIEANTIDVVHLHWKDDLPLVTLARNICNKKFMIVHTRHMDLPGSKKDILHRYMYRNINKYIVITDHLKEQAMKYLPLSHDRIRRIYYGCNMPTPMTDNDIEALKKEMNISNGFFVGVIGRIEPQKGQHLFISAISRLRHEGCDINGLIVGHAMSNAYLQEVKELISRKNLENHISLLPFQKDPTKIIQCLDVLVLPTVKETFGIILVEAMLAGIAVIGSDAGGVPEIINHNETGMLFKSGDVASLTESIRTLYENRDLRDAVAAAGKKKAEITFNKELQFNKILNELIDAVHV